MLQQRPEWVGFPEAPCSPVQTSSSPCGKGTAGPCAARPGVSSGVDACLRSREGGALWEIIIKKSTGRYFLLGYFPQGWYFPLMQISWWAEWWPLMRGSCTVVLCYDNVVDLF